MKTTCELRHETGEGDPNEVYPLPRRLAMVLADKKWIYLCLRDTIRRSDQAESLVLVFHAQGENDNDFDLVRRVCESMIRDGVEWLNSEEV